MKRIERAMLIAFVASVVLGQGCITHDKRHETFDLAGKIYTEKFTCNQTFTGQPAFCPDLDEVNQLHFQSTGSSTFEVRNIPDTGFVIDGTLIGLSFDWTATSPNGYSESGTWTFSSGGGSFSGPSHYMATDGSYSGDCNTNGVRGLTAPPDPPLPDDCP